MIVKPWNQPHVIYQTADADDAIPNPTIIVHVDNSGTLCITQESECICLNYATVPELCKLLKQMTG